MGQLIPGPVSSQWPASQALVLDGLWSSLAGSVVMTPAIERSLRRSSLSGGAGPGAGSSIHRGD